MVETMQVLLIFTMKKKKKRLNHTLPVAVHDMPYPSEPWAKRKCYSGAFLVMISLSPPLMNSYY